jgi:hypothetical protein
VKPNIEWTPDCSGKWDYDGHIISISTRYWPAGGGFHVSNGGVFVDSAEIFPHIKPSAHARIVLRCAGYDESLDLIGKEFEAGTEAEVKAQVESWVQEQFERVAAAMQAEFQRKEQKP